MTASTPESAGIFISYRRKDSGYAAGWLFDLLADHFGESRIFKDVDSIRLGDDFVEEISVAVGSCMVLLAVIGERWLTVTGEGSRRRLDDPADFVRLEIEAALKRGVRVIPVLVNGARMPGAAALPASLEQLARRHALELRPDRFKSDTGHLLKMLDSLTNVTDRPTSQSAGDGGFDAGGDHLVDTSADGQPDQQAASGQRSTKPAVTPPQTDSVASLDISVPVMAQWARWGKTGGDRWYHVLEHSDGAFAATDFETAITRYSPGTIEDVPQVSVSWLQSRHEPNYLAMAIHDFGERQEYDAFGRDILFTRYFCVPYGQLAQQAVSYQAMYKGFREFSLLASRRTPIVTELPTRLPSVHADERAVRVAALLLTKNPVCILGADQASLDDRLRFIDLVMSWLPYGIRSRMSASTWASSTFRGHNFRLFFADAPRRGDLDRVVHWGQFSRTPIGHPHADQYLNWLYSIQRPEALLAWLTEQISFNEDDIVKMLEQISVLPRGQMRPRYRRTLAGRPDDNLLQ